MSLIADDEVTLPPRLLKHEALARSFRWLFLGRAVFLTFIAIVWVGAASNPQFAIEVPEIRQALGGADGPRLTLQFLVVLAAPLFSLIAMAGLWKVHRYSVHFALVSAAFLVIECFVQAPWTISLVVHSLVPAAILLSLVLSKTGREVYSQPFRELLHQLPHMKRHPNYIPMAFYLAVVISAVMAERAIARMLAS